MATKGKREEGIKGKEEVKEGKTERIILTGNHHTPLKPCP